MIAWFVRRWRELRNGKPGSRFVDFYQLRQKSRRAPWLKIVLMGIGVVIFVAGMVMLVIPGPGVLAMLLGAGLLAQESYYAALAADWLELRIRPLAERAMRRFKQQM